MKTSNDDFRLLLDCLIHPPAYRGADKPEILPATRDQAPVLVNLLELYAHDFSEFRRLSLTQDGRFGYPNLSLYWIESGRHPFLIRVRDELAGFALLKKGSELSGNAAAWDMAEFFVVRGFRKCGIGTQVAHDLWRRFPGPWEVRVLASNHDAQRFWRRAISEFTGYATPSVSIDQANTLWSLFTFESPRQTKLAKPTAIIVPLP